MTAALEGIRELVLARWPMLVRRNVRGAQALAPGCPLDDASNSANMASAPA